MLKLNKLQPEEIYRVAQVEGSLNTLYHALAQIHGEIAEACPAAAYYLVEAMGNIDSAIMASIKMFDKNHKN